MDNSDKNILWKEALAIILAEKIKNKFIEKFMKSETVKSMLCNDDIDVAVKMCINELESYLRLHEKGIC